MSTKVCTRCHEAKPIGEFPLRKGTKTPTYSWCYPCTAAYNRERNLRVLFGLTIDEYDELLERQDGGCAICGRGPTKRRLHVDHDHKTGDVRGLLCWRCNELVGKAADWPELLMTAALYLTREPFKRGSAVRGRVKKRSAKRAAARRRQNQIQAEPEAVQ